MWDLNNHYQSNRLKRSANPKTPMNTLSPLKPFVTDKTIAIPTDNTPIKLQGFNVFNLSNHLIFEFNNKLKKLTDPYKLRSLVVFIICCTKCSNRMPDLSFK